MKYFLSSLAALTAAFNVSFSSAAIALTRQDISSQTALSSVPEITVPEGHSVVLQFQNDHYIQSLWIDDPTILGIATDRPLCSGFNDNRCGFATSVRFTQLSGDIALPGASFANDSGLSTLVSISTTNRAGNNPLIYQFLVNTVSSQTADISIVTITPNRQAATQVAEDNTTALLRSIRPNYDLDKIRHGRELAVRQGIADTASEAWIALESFLVLTDSGASIASAIQATEVPLRLLAELERMAELSPSGDFI